MMLPAVAVLLPALLHFPAYVRARWAAAGVPNPDVFPGLDDVPDTGPVVGVSPCIAYTRPLDRDGS
jgi:hypothetical protein